MEVGILTFCSSSNCKRWHPLNTACTHQCTESSNKKAACTESSTETLNRLAAIPITHSGAKQQATGLLLL